jgi:hypothetical protein
VVIAVPVLRIWVEVGEARPRIAVIDALAHISLAMVDACAATTLGSAPCPAPFTTLAYAYRYATFANRRGYDVLSALPSW